MKGINYINSYLEKQKNFKILVKDIQYSLQNKEYQRNNLSIDDYIKNRWNISKAQAYRYVISAKVIDQLEEFNIQPCYERICRALYNCAKTQSQMKLLWGSVLQSSGNRPDCINSSHVNKMWKKLCSDKKYFKICHYEEEIMNKIENSLNHHAKDVKHKQLNSKINSINAINVADALGTPKSLTPSPIISSISSTSLFNGSVIPSPVQSESEYTNSSSFYPSPMAQSESNLIPYRSPSPLSICDSGIDLCSNSDISNGQINSNIIAVPTTVPSVIPTTVSSTIPTTISTTIPSTIPSTIPTTIPTTVPVSQNVNVVNYEVLGVQYPLQSSIIITNPTQIQVPYPQQVLYYY